MDASDEQPRKARSSMLVRPAGSSTDASDEQRTKALSPMLVRPAGSWTDALVICS